MFTDFKTMTWAAEWRPVWKGSNHMKNPHNSDRAPLGARHRVGGSERTVPTVRGAHPQLWRKVQGGGLGTRGKRGQETLRSWPAPGSFHPTPPHSPRTAVSEVPQRQPFPSHFCALYKATLSPETGSGPRGIRIFPPLSPARETALTAQQSSRELFPSTASIHTRPLIQAGHWS